MPTSVSHAILPFGVDVSLLDNNQLLCFIFLHIVKIISDMYIYGSLMFSVALICLCTWCYISIYSRYYRSVTVNSNTVNSKFHLIRSYCEIFFYHFPNISCLKCTVNSNFHFIRSKTLLTNDFELTVPDLYRENHPSLYTRSPSVKFGYNG